jgi:hypothetical protein
MGKRKCGPCNVCCISLGVPELNKGHNVKCSHLKTGTRCCKIYKDRPFSCETFRCGWLEGAGSHRHRPDKSGVVLCPSRALVEGGLKIVQAREARQLAFSGSYWNELLNIITEAGYAAVMVPFGADKARTLKGDASQIEAFVKWVGGKDALSK